MTIASGGRPSEDQDEYEETGYFSIYIEDRRYIVPLYCPHRAGRLDHGKISQRRRTITCPLHHSTFCLETGAQLAGPACGALGVSRQDAEGAAAGGGDICR